MTYQNKTAQRPTQKPAQKPASKPAAQKTASRPAEEAPAGWENISGRIRIYLHEFNDKLRFSTSIYRKDENGNTARVFFDVVPVKGCEFGLGYYDETPAYIEGVCTGWLGVSVWSDGTAHPVIFLSEFSPLVG